MDRDKKFHITRDGKLCPCAACAIASHFPDEMNAEEISSVMVHLLIGYRVEIREAEEMMHQAYSMFQDISVAIEAQDSVKELIERVTKKDLT